MNNSHEIHVAIYMPRGPGSESVYTVWLPVVTEFGHTLTEGLWVRTAGRNRSLRDYVRQWADELGVDPDTVSMDLATLGQLHQGEEFGTRIVLAGL